MIKKNKTTAFRITELLKDSLLFSEDYHRNWTMALYVAINDALGLPEVKLEYKFKYNQWAVDHNMRAIKSSNKGKISSSSLVVARHPDGVEIFYRQNGDSQTFVLSAKNFPPGLYRDGQGPHGAAILIEALDVNLILGALLDDCPNPRLNFIKPQANVPDRVEPNRALSTDLISELNNAQLEKIWVYHELLNVVHPFYKEQEGEARKSFITTLFGAGLFYLPHGVKHWVGKISVTCLMEQIVGTSNARKVKDHIFPRKAAADYLLNNLTQKEEFLQFYMDKVAPYMYVTPNENSMLINYYQDFEKYEDALEHFGIQEFPPDDHIFNSTKELNSFIQFCEGRVRSRTQPAFQVLKECYIEFNQLNTL